MIDFRPGWPAPDIMLLRDQEPSGQSSHRRMRRGERIDLVSAKTGGVRRRRRPRLMSQDGTLNLGFQCGVRADVNRVTKMGEGHGNCLHSSSLSFHMAYPARKFACGRPAVKSLAWPDKKIPSGRGGPLDDKSAQTISPIAGCHWVRHSGSVGSSGASHAQIAHRRI